MDYNLFGRQRIPHYYGDTVRTLYITAVVLGLVGLPIWGSLLSLGIAFDIAAGIILIAIAGLMNPHSPFVMGVSVLASSFAAFLFEYFAITHYVSNDLLLLLGRQTEAVLFVTALYFSVKTLRAMALKKIGEVEPPWEFEDANKQAVQ